MKKLIVVLSFILISCNTSGYNQSTGKYSKSEADKNFLKKLHNWIITADDIMNTETETHTSSHTYNGKTISCTSTIVRKGLEAPSAGIYERKISEVSSRCSDGSYSKSTYD